MTQGETRKGLPATKRIQTPSWSLSDTLEDCLETRRLRFRKRRNVSRSSSRLFVQRVTFRKCLITGSWGEKVGRIMEGISSLKEFACAVLKSRAIVVPPLSLTWLLVRLSREREREQRFQTFVLATNVSVLEWNRKCLVPCLNRS